MAELDQIYGAAFFREWGPAHSAYVRSAELIADEIYRQFSPCRVADIGCGCGVYGYFFQKRGVEVLFLDGVIPPAEHSFPVTIHKQDLTVPFENKWGRFDIVLCLEVAEHIPEPLSGAFLENIIRFGDTLIMAAAPPHQGGHYHYNEQPKRYWVRRLAGMDFIYSRGKTGRLFKALSAQRPPYGWMMQQLCVYERVAQGERCHRSVLPFDVRVPGKKAAPERGRPAEPILL
ncbi:MAG: class I SAM-dependent methyltransferase [Chitinispirillaceae bacterium]|nr:class I SAM-dependent methyltransferase [Chitinispirillaceae bacterium]